MKQAAMQGRRLVLGLAVVAAVLAMSVLAMSVLAVPVASAQMGGNVDALRRAAAYAEQMRPTGLTALRTPPQATLARLQRTPELQRAVTLFALDESDTLPFHLQGTFTLTGDWGRQRSGTVQEDRYNDRWSRFSVTLDSVSSSQWVLNGRRFTDDRIPAFPFGLQRLLRAALSPLSDLATAKIPISADLVQQDDEQLHCTVFGRQPPLELGITPAGRSVCLDPVSGDLRLDVGGYGFRTVYSDVQALGNRRVPLHVQVFQGNAVTADLHFALRVAGELTPASFAEDEAHAGAHPAPPEPHFCWMARPWQMRTELEMIDAHLVPLGDTALKQRGPVIVARVLADGDGRLADVEILGSADPKLSEHALRLLHAAAFHRHVWKGQPTSVEGLLLLGTP